MPLLVMFPAQVARDKSFSAPVAHSVNTEDAGSSVKQLPRNMPASALIETRFLILRKTPFSETSLIVGGISPEFGQLHFLVRGARKLSKRSFPVADLFRVLQVKYAPSNKGTLYTWRCADLEASYSDVAQSTATYTTAS